MENRLVTVRVTDDGQESQDGRDVIIIIGCNYK